MTDKSAVDALRHIATYEGDDDPWKWVATLQLVARDALATLAAEELAEGPCQRCGEARDRGIHDTPETCEAVRGPCLDPERHHPFARPTPAREGLDESREEVPTDAELATANNGGPVAAAALERLAKGIDAAVTLWLIGGDTDQRYTPTEVATEVHRLAWEQYERLAAEYAALAREERP